MPFKSEKIYSEDKKLVAREILINEKEELIWIIKKINTWLLDLFNEEYWKKRKDTITWNNYNHYITYNELKEEYIKNVNRIDITELEKKELWKQQEYFKLIDDIKQFDLKTLDKLIDILEVSNQSETTFFWTTSFNFFPQTLSYSSIEELWKRIEKLKKYYKKF